MVEWLQLVFQAPLSELRVVNREQAIHPEE